jgi:hypothetical protein
VTVGRSADLAIPAATFVAAEGSALAVGAAGPLAAVIIVAAGVAFWRAAAPIVAAVAEATTTRGILGAGAAGADAAAFAGLTTPVFPAPLVLLFLLPFAAFAEIRATLAVATARVTLQAAPFDEHIVCGGKPQVSPGERNQGKSRSGHVPERGPAVAQSGYQAGPVVEPAFVHAGLSSSLFQTRRASRISGYRAATCQYAK